MIHIKKYFSSTTLGVFLFATIIVTTAATCVYSYKVYRDNVVNTELSKRVASKEAFENVNDAIELKKKQDSVRGVSNLYIEKYPNVITEQHKADLSKHEGIMLSTTSHDEFDESHVIVNGIIEELKALQQEYDAEQQRIREEEERKAREAEEAKKKQEQQVQQVRQVRQQNTGGGGSGLTASSGVFNFNGRRETYYSSRVLYHYRTPEWWVDGEGFYRTPEGYYVVAASDMAQGTVFQGSKGLCQVLDAGCSAGTTDYYVNW